MLNATAAVLMLLCAYEHIRSDDQLRFALAAIGTLYVVTAISFACCALMLALDGNWVLSAPPKNWAEDFNSIMSLVGLTGIGAITLTLHHARAAHHHHQAANTDSLTGVLNRRALFDRFSNAPPGRNSAVLMFDLDHFKQINDRLGHAEGDRVLKLFSDVLQRELGPLDVISRIGGEEFCAVLIDVDQEKAKAVAERVRSVFADLTLVIEQGQLHATVSVGLAMFEGDEDFPALLNRADAALYQAKHNGRNQVKLAALRLVA
jgi:diguanylate cyclase (GGDEF)-like protein